MSESTPERSRPSDIELEVRNLVRLFDEITYEIALDESDVGRVARAFLRARRDGKAELVHALGEPLTSMLERIIKRPPKTPRITFSRSEMVQIRSLAATIEC